jgi:uncharacterized membrane protein
MTTTTLCLRAGLLGLVSGLRSTYGLTALTLTSGARPGRSQRPPRPLVALSSVASAGEFVGDKLPQTPSRLEPPALGARMVLGSLAGGWLAVRTRGSRPLVVLGASIGGAGAALGSHLGSQWRGAAADHFGTDLPGALIEDAVAASVATVAAR